MKTDSYDNKQTSISRKVLPVVGLFLFCSSAFLWVFLSRNFATGERSPIETARIILIAASTLLVLAFSAIGALILLLRGDTRVQTLRRSANAVVILAAIFFFTAMILEFI